MNGAADRLEHRADDLREDFLRDFLVHERGCYALALDGDKRQVDGLTSNVGHLLWSGILDDGRAATIAERLLNDELYSGTVWPHDNSLIAAGLARYGHHEAAGTIASAILAAAPYFEYRLPEVFAGFPRPLTSVPVAFPTASRPQAWAAGAPLLLLTTLLHLRPGRADVQADLPETIGHVAIRRQPRHAPSPPAPSTV